jgi:hypothetical protein
LIIRDRAAAATNTAAKINVAQEKRNINNNANPSNGTPAYQ